MAVDEGVDEGQLGVAGGEHGMGHAPLGHGPAQDGGGIVGGRADQGVGVEVDRHPHLVDRPLTSSSPAWAHRLLRAL